MPVSLILGYEVIVMTVILIYLIHSPFGGYSSHMNNLPDHSPICIPSSAANKIYGPNEKERTVLNY